MKNQACANCLITLTKENAWANRQRKKFQRVCKACTSLYKKQCENTNRLQIREYKKEYYIKNKKMIREQNEKSRIKRFYNITFEEASKLRNQPCQICKTVKATDIDHCHLTGKVRGGLCNKCNKGLGHFEDSKELLAAAVEYLKLAG